MGYIYSGELACLAQQSNPDPALPCSQTQLPRTAPPRLVPVLRKRAS